MKLDRFREPDEAPFVPIVALVDVLFFVIIFLVLGASFDAVETQDLPQARGQGSAAPEALAVELRGDGQLALDGQVLAPGEAVARIRPRAGHGIVLLPDARAEVGSLLRWYDLLQRELGVPVRVGVRAPEP
jgi:biopolymer transport protein ExbD